MKQFFSLLLIAFIWSCSKSNDLSSNNPLVGSFTFTNASSSTNSWNFNNTSDSIYIIFDDANRYIFKQYNFPADKGKYKIINGAEIIFTSDTTNSTLFAFTHLLPFGMPFTDSAYKSQFSSDRYFFTKSNLNQLDIKRTWTTIAQPGDSTGAIIFHFKPR